MSISQADLQVISTVFGKSTDELSGALSSENEVSLGLRLNGRVITQEDEHQLKTNLTDAGIEIGYKKLAKEAGIDLSAGEKDASIIADKLKTSITTTLEEKYKNMTPTEEMQALKEKAEEWELKYSKLNETYEQTSEKINEWKEKYTQKEKEVFNKELNNKILGSLPDKMKIDKSDALVIFRNIIETENTEAGQVFKRDGKTITDAIGNPEVLDNIVKSFVEEKKWVRGSGMGGDDSGSGSPGPKGYTPDQAFKYLKDNNIEPGSVEGLKKFKELTKK